MLGDRVPPEGSLDRRGQVFGGRKMNGNFTSFCSRDRNCSVRGHTSCASSPVAVPRLLGASDSAQQLFCTLFELRYQTRREVAEAIVLLRDEPSCSAYLCRLSERYLDALNSAPALMEVSATARTLSDRRGTEPGVPRSLVHTSKRLACCPNPSG